MTAAYLYLNAALYLSFALWMTLNPWKTATGVGYEVLSSSGRSEYLVIYGGLQLGLAIFFAATAASAEWQRLGIIFALCLYAPVVLYRIITVMKFGPVKSTTLAVGGMELLLLLGAVILGLDYAQ
jgi:hypothetical protein